MKISRFFWAKLQIVRHFKFAERSKEKIKQK